MPVVILSDTFHELAEPLLASLGHPLTLCHRLIIDGQGWVTDFRIRKPNAKKEAVLAFQELGYRVVAVGDSLNDIDMLDAADQGLLISPSICLNEQIKKYPTLSSLYGIQEYFYQDFISLQVSLPPTSFKKEGSF
jgi:phosphoserine/homoserine phosphotransferase